MAAPVVEAGHGRLQHVVLVGAGHAHVEVLRSFAMSRPAGVRLTLITRAWNALYSGMLPGVIAGLYPVKEAHIDTRPLAAAAGATVVRAEAVGLNLNSRHVLCRDLPPVPYDVASFDIGSTPNTEGVAGAADHAIPVKPIDGFLSRFEALRHRVRERAGGSRIVLVGGGAGGIELVLSVERRLRAEATEADPRSRPLKFAVVCASATILPEFPASFRRRCRRILQSRDIDLIENARVTAVAPGRVHIGEDRAVPADEVLWVTEAAAPKWLGPTGLCLDQTRHLGAELIVHELCLGEPTSWGSGLAKSNYPECPASGDGFRCRAHELVDQPQAQCSRGFQRAIRRGYSVD